jgi:hypothetical protein
MRLRDQSPGNEAEVQEQPGPWEISLGGKVDGPYQEEDLISAIESGQILKALVRRAGTAGWRELKSYPPFAAALRRAASTQPLRVPR